MQSCPWWLWALAATGVGGSLLLLAYIAFEGDDESVDFDEPPLPTTFDPAAVRQTTVTR